MLKIASSGCGHSECAVTVRISFHACDIVHNLSLLDIHCANPGNPVFTCDKRTAEKSRLYTFDPKGDSHHITVILVVKL